ncbi:MAG: putative RNA methylase [Halioglobus sp.]|jgi:predicted RNA methylase
MDIKRELLDITSEYLEDSIDFHKLMEATRKYKNLLEGLSDSQIGNEVSRNDLVLESGKAIGAFWAAACIDDFNRTRKFLRGIDDVVSENIEIKKELHILYAGTGPFASLILPTILRYPKANIKYTLLEVNPLSYNVLSNIINKIGLEEYNIELVMDDATKYQMDADVDIIISETMQNALEKEQQVPIFYNLMSQAKRDIIFIPEKIEIFIGLKESGIPTEKLEESNYQKQSRIFELSKSAIGNSNWDAKKPIAELTFPNVQTIIEKEALSNYNQVVLITEITVFNDEVIGLNESGLTTPKSIYNMDSISDDSLVLDTQYTIGVKPKFEIKISLNKSDLSEDTILTI